MEKGPTIENKINIFEFKKWLDNCIDDAVARGLKKDDLYLPFLEKAHEIYAMKKAGIKREQIKNLAENKEMNILEFKRWLDNCVIDAEARGLSEDDISSALVEKSPELIKSERE